MDSKETKKWYYVLPVVSIGIFILAWVWLSSAENSMIPTPLATWEKFLNIMTNPISQAINAVVDPIFEMLRPIPPIAWIPLIILWFGIGETSKIIIVFIGSFVPIVLNTYSGIKEIDPLLVSAGKVLGANRRQILLEITLPATVPAILAGIRTALSSGWMCVVAAEMIVAKQGVGFLIVRGQESGDTALIVVCMLVIGIVSMLLSTILSKLEGVLCPWQFSKTK